MSLVSEPVSAPARRQYALAHPSTVVLMVHPDAELRSMVTAALRQDRARVLDVPALTDAIAVLEVLVPDALILDSTMVEDAGDWRWFASIVDRRSIPIVFIGDALTHDHRISTTVADVVELPVSASVLRSVLRRVRLLNH